MAINHFSLSIKDGFADDVSITYIVRGETFKTGPGTFEQDEETGVIPSQVKYTVICILESTFTLG